MLLKSSGVSVVEHSQFLDEFLKHCKTTEDLLKSSSFQETSFLDDLRSVYTFLNRTLVNEIIDAKQDVMESVSTKGNVCVSNLPLLDWEPVDFMHLNAFLEALKEDVELIDTIWKHWEETATFVEDYTLTYAEQLHVEGFFNKHDAFFDVAIYYATLSSGLELMYLIHNAVIAMAARLKSESSYGSILSQLVKVWVGLWLQTVHQWKELFNLRNNINYAEHSYAEDTEKFQQKKMELTSSDYYYIAHHSMVGSTQDHSIVFLSHRGSDTKWGLENLHYIYKKENKADRLFLDCQSIPASETCDSFIWRGLGRSVIAFIIDSVDFDKSIYCRKEKEAIALLHELKHIKIIIHKMTYLESYIDVARKTINKLLCAVPVQNFSFKLEASVPVPPSVKQSQIKNLTDITKLMVYWSRCLYDGKSIDFQADDISTIPEVDLNSLLSVLRPHATTMPDLDNLWKAITGGEISKAHPQYEKLLIFTSISTFGVLSLKTLNRCYYPHLSKLAKFMYDSVKKPGFGILVQLLGCAIRSSNQEASYHLHSLMMSLSSGRNGKAVRSWKLKKHQCYDLFFILWLGNYSPIFFMCARGECPDGNRGGFELSSVPMQNSEDVGMHHYPVVPNYFPNSYSFTDNSCLPKCSCVCDKCSTLWIPSQNTLWLP